MTKVKFLDLEFQPYISAAQVGEATKRIAAQIDGQYADCTKPPVLLITLSGAMIWAGQLIHELNTQFEWAFIKCSSYGAEIETCGCVTLQLQPTIELRGRDVLVVEDMVDTGTTWEFLHKYILEQGATSLKIATMALKPEAYKLSLPIDYVALEVENKFIIGNGLDYNQQGRNLKDLYILCK